MSDTRDFPFNYSRSTALPTCSLAEVAVLPGDRSALISEENAPISPPYRLWTSETLAKPPTRTPGAVYIRSVANVEVYGPNLLLRGGTLVSPEDTEPFYVENHTKAGWLTNYQRFPAYSAQLPRVDVPVAYFVSHFNQGVYGHFLLEIVPKLFHINRLRRASLEFPIVLSTEAPPWIEAIINTVCPGIKIIKFNPKKEVMRIAKCLLISNCFSLNYFIHQQTVTDFRLFAAEARSRALQVPKPSRIFVVRDNPNSFRYMTNLAKVRAICSDHGFTAIDPTKYTWIEQASIFNNAKLVVGEFTSALHNAVFSPPGTAVMCLFWLGHLQEGLCSSFGQRIGYVLPKDKRLLTYDAGDHERKRFDFEIDLDELQARLKDLTAFD